MGKPVPANQKMWDQLMSQAQAKYPKRSPKATTSFAANKWAKEQYEKMGGQYVASLQDVPTGLRDFKGEAEKKKKAKIAKAKRQSQI